MSDVKATEYTETKIPRLCVKNDTNEKYFHLIDCKDVASFGKWRVELMMDELVRECNEYSVVPCPKCFKDDVKLTKLFGDTVNLNKTIKDLEISGEPVYDKLKSLGQAIRLIEKLEDKNGDIFLAKELLDNAYKETSKQLTSINDAGSMRIKLNALIRCLEIHLAEKYTRSETI